MSERRTHRGPGIQLPIVRRSSDRQRRMELKAPHYPGLDCTRNFWSCQEGFFRNLWVHVGGVFGFSEFLGSTFDSCRVSSVRVGGVICYGFKFLVLKVDRVSVFQGDIFHDYLTARHPGPSKVHLGMAAGEAFASPTCVTSRRRDDGSP